MARNKLKLKHFENKMAETIDGIDDVFDFHKQKLEAVFAELINFRDDPDTKSEEAGLINDKVVAGKALIQGVLDNVIVN